MTVPLDRWGLAVRLWVQNVTQTCVSKNVSECLEMDLPGTKADAVAMGLVLSKIPMDWEHEASEKGSAMRAIEWLKNKFPEGHNPQANGDW